MTGRRQKTDLYHVFIYPHPSWGVCNSLKSSILYDMRKWISILLLLFSLRYAGYAQGNAKPIGFNITDPKGKVTIPFELHNNLIVISLLFNHRLPLKFIVDTGVRNTVLIQKSIGTFLNLKPTRKMTLVGAAGGKGVSAYVANDVDIDMPGVEGRNLSILILDEDYLELGPTVGMDIHGILGYDLFSRFITKIDYDRSEITFYKPDYFNPPKHYDIWPLTVEDTKPYLKVRLYLSDTTTIMSKLMVDTGASHSLMLHANSSSCIYVPDLKIREILGKGIGGPINGYVSRTSHVVFPTDCFADVITSFPDKGTYQSVIKDTGRNGTIGGGLLKRYTVIFDYFGGHLYMRKASRYKDSFDYDMSGLEIEGGGKDYHKIIVKRVREGTPADLAGVKAGDQIIKVNSASGDGLKINTVNNILSQKPGRKIKMTVIRDGIKYKFIFRLKRLI